jgi:hypothetical protein
MKQLVKLEALRRMRKLNLKDEVIQQFEGHGIIHCSESFGFTTRLSEYELSLVSRYQDFYIYRDLIIYHVIKEDTVRGPMYTYLFVSSDDIDTPHKDLFDSLLRDNTIHCFDDAAETGYRFYHEYSYVEPLNGGLIIKHIYTIEEFKKLVKFEESERYQYYQRLQQMDSGLEHALRAARVTTWVQNQYDLKDEDSIELFERLIDVFSKQDSIEEDSLAEEIAREMEII